MAAGLAFPPAAYATGGDDVLIVLGAGAAPEGWANPVLVERVCRAAAEYLAGRAGKLLATGGYTAGHIAEAEMMRAAAVAMGVPAGDILVERAAVNTAENAAFSARLARRHGLRRAALVTHRSHLPRAHAALEAAGGAWWLAVDDVAADGALSTGCFRLPPAPEGKPFDMLIVDVTEELPIDEAAEREADVPSPRLLAAVGRAVAAYRAGTRRLYFALPEPSTSTAAGGEPSASGASASGHITRTELARVLATAMGVPWDSVTISSGRRLGQVPGAVEPAEDPWLRIPGARLGLLAPQERREWWRAQFRRGANALIAPPEELGP